MFEKLAEFFSRNEKDDKTKEEFETESQQTDDVVEQFIEKLKELDVEQKENSLKKVKENIRSFHGTLSSEESSSTDFIPEMSVSQRKYGDFLIINSLQSADQSYFRYYENDELKIRLDSVSKFTVSDDEISVPSNKNALKLYQEGKLNEDNDDLFNLSVGVILRDELDVINHIYFDNDEKIENYIREESYKKLNPYRNFWSYKNDIYELPKITLYIETKYGQTYEIFCSPFIFEKVVDALENVLDYGEFDPEKYKGEK